MEEKQHAKKCATRHEVFIPGGVINPRPCDCDGYHTFNELYEHRITLFITLCSFISSHPDYGVGFLWRSKNHSDGEPAFGGGWFVLGIGKEKGEQITYHLPMSKWEDINFAETLEKAPEFDGHTSDDVLDRLRRL